MRLPKEQRRVFRLPCADAPESRERLSRSMSVHGLFVPTDDLEPLGAEFPLQLTFLNGRPVVSGRVQVVDHGTTGRLRGYFVKYVELDPGSLELPLNPARSRPRAGPPGHRAGPIPRVFAEPVTEPGVHPDDVASAPEAPLAVSSTPSTFRMRGEQLEFRRELLNRGARPSHRPMEPPPGARARGLGDFPPEEATPGGILPHTVDETTTGLNDYSNVELLHAVDPYAWQGGLRPFDDFGPYQLLRRLGVGGMAEVLLARRRMGDGVDKLVALKLVFQEYASHPRLSALFLTEARLSATLQHPNLIQVFDVGSAAGRAFMAMEYVHGRNGSELIQRLRERGGPPPIALAVALVIELGRALEYLHEKKDLDGRHLHLVHRDVSPGNLLIGMHGSVKLVDMGVASASIATGHDTLRVGKRAYMSPEQMCGGMPDPGWDIYGMGLVLHELLTLERAFESTTTRWKLRPSTSNPQVPAELDRLVQWATEHDRTRRAPSARALRVALERVRLSLPPCDLVRTMRDLFGEELDEAQRETETLIAVARQRDGGEASRAWRRVTRALVGLTPRAVWLLFARHRSALRWGVAALVAVLMAAGVPLWRHQQQEALLVSHLERADALVAAAKLVGPGEDTALAQLQAALELRPGDARTRSRLQALADTFTRLGEAAERRGDVSEAAAHYRAALEADASREPLRERMRALEEEVRARNRTRQETP
ncbi:protein kinase [Pyxidicoccus parkwayensis]|uniref:Protein kinase n=1 Tax=Pyxidicoccus parkwayensis TaxID=2813578 RepID=A0ABX7NJ61_9BACT|nr:protein kinase [Pyxidicoccus parkwaysis]QSQ18854.1 protein kinase [Pyxidicoccus parkwaysis]